MLIRAPLTQFKINVWFSETMLCDTWPHTIYAPSNYLRECIHTLLRTHKVGISTQIKLEAQRWNCRRCLAVGVVVIENASFASKQLCYFRDSWNNEFILQCFSDSYFLIPIYTSSAGIVRFENLINRVHMKKCSPIILAWSAANDMSQGIALLDDTFKHPWQKDKTDIWSGALNFSWLDTRCHPFNRS